LKDTKTPVKIGVIAMVANVFFDIILMGSMGHRGLALATAISGSVNFIFLMFLLKKRLKRIDGHKIFSSTVKMCISAAVMGIFCYFMSDNELFLTNTYLTKRVGLLAFTIASGVVIYALSSLILKCEEFYFVKDMLQNKLKRVK
ncbi:lipid II flippase MurJ, partial [Thermodesulfobacteriota bacterium]